MKIEPYMVALHRCIASLYYFTLIGNRSRKIRIDITPYTPFIGSSASHVVIFMRVLIPRNAGYYQPGCEKWHNTTEKLIGICGY